MTGNSRADAVERLEMALVEQTRCGERYRASLGTSSEFGAFVALQHASEQVDARQTWLHQIDERAGDLAGGREAGDG